MNGNQWKHLRLPFGWVLAPVFVLAFAQSTPVHVDRLWNAIVCQFFFLYPASHAFNSFFDKDTQSIGGLKFPPPVDRALLWGALLLDTAAVVLGLCISVEYAAGLLVYGVVSKAYSHPRTRWKARPWLGWACASFFQGAWTYLLSLHAVQATRFSVLVTQPKVLAFALLSTFWIASSYPITQIYQHAEDQKRGDLTLSRVLGVRGTLLFSTSGVVFSVVWLWVAAVLFHQEGLALAICVGLAPALPFGLALWKTKEPDYDSVMDFVWGVATGLNVALLYYRMIN